MASQEPVVGLRAARTARGWSQSQAARALAALAQERDADVAAPASLKTQLSRWENGHAAPDRTYRELLAELYRRAPADLGLPAAGHDGSPAERVHARVARAAAVDAGVVTLWEGQLAAAAGLDERLGPGGATDAVRVLVDQLEEVLPYVPDPPRRRGVAELLARALLLAAAHAAEGGAPDAALARYGRAVELARAARAADLAVAAVVGAAAVLVEVGEPEAALAALEHANPARTPGARARLAAARAATRAAAGDAAGARGALDAVGRCLHARTDAVHAGLAVEVTPDHDASPLGDVDEVGHRAAALPGGPRSARDRARLHADLARALAATGDAAAAAAHADAARACRGRPQPPAASSSASAAP
jgi:transcriptional regulator with XRE-family HTH domain